MKKSSSLIKHAILSLLIISVLGGILFIPSQKKAEAVTAGLVQCVGGLLNRAGIGNIGETLTDEISGVGSGEVPVRDKGVIDQTRITAKKTTSLEDKEKNLDPCIKGIVQEIVHQMTTSIINWINNGFEGSPTFITNPEGFFADIADQTLGLFLEGAGLDFLCTPFKLDIQLQLRQIYRQDARVYCTPLRVAEVFGLVERDFSETGWDGWLELTANDENNYYGSWVRSNNDISAATNYRINSTLEELAWGNGFLSVRDPETGEINTPGSLIVGQADQVLGSNLRELELAKEFDDIIYALINQLTNQLLTKGLRSN